MPHSILAIGETSPVSVSLCAHNVGGCPGYRFRACRSAPSRRVRARCSDYAEAAMARPPAMLSQPIRARSRKTS